MLSIPTFKVSACYVFHVYPVRDSPEGLSIYFAPLGMHLYCAGRRMVQSNHSKAYATILTDRGRSRTTLPSTVELVEGMGDVFTAVSYTWHNPCLKPRACEHDANDTSASVVMFFHWNRMFLCVCVCGCVRVCENIGLSPCCGEQ